jgi:hypothetical protein
MASAATPPTQITPGKENRLIPGSTHTSDAQVRLQDVIILESCHTLWVFNPGWKQFCRILKGIEVAGRSVSTQWRPYWQLELDPDTENFSVYLTASRNRLIRSWRHAQNCDQCGGRGLTELSLEDIPPMVHVCGTSGPQNTHALIASQQPIGVPESDLPVSAQPIVDFALR